MEKKERDRTVGRGCAFFGKHVLLCEDNEMNTEIAKKSSRAVGLS